MADLTPLRFVMLPITFASLTRVSFSVDGIVTPHAHSCLMPCTLAEGQITREIELIALAFAQIGVDGLLRSRWSAACTAPRVRSQKESAA